MARSPRFYLPGSGGYDADRAKELRRQQREAKQALASAKRAKAGPDAIRKAKQRTARIERELVKVAVRQERRAGLSEHDRRAFNRLGVGKQNRFLSRLQKEAGPDYRDRVLQVLIRYPDSPPPKSVPDPFAGTGENRNAHWVLYYRSLARKKRRARRMREAAE
jgi:hypothetical protein